MRLTESEINYLLDLISKSLPSGFGYSKEPAIAQLQAKLSIMLQVQSQGYSTGDLARGRPLMAEPTIDNPVAR